MAPHGMSADGHPVGVSGEVSIDEFGELRDRRMDRGQLTDER